MAGIAGICEALTALLKSRTEWDEAPGLYFLYAEHGNVRVSAESLIPATAWAERPPETLAVFADVLSVMPPGMLSMIAPLSLIGAVFRCEAWKVIGSDDDPVAACQLIDAQRARRLDVHPDRIEERTAWAVTRDGAQYVASQARGERRIDSQKVDGAVRGLIPKSLERIVRAISAGVN